MAYSTPKSLRQLHPRRVDIVLLLAASAVLLGLGLSRPVLTTRKLWESTTFSILSGVTGLWQEKFYFLSAVIFFFSVIFPIGKLVVLLLTWFLKLSDHRRKWILNGLSLLGKWSMLDVFVAAVLIVSVKLGALASAKVEPGIYFFAASIFLAMIVTSLQSHLARSSKPQS